MNRKFKMMKNTRSIKRTERSRVGFVILFCLAGTGNGFLEGASVAAYFHTFISNSFHSSLLFIQNRRFHPSLRQ